MVKIRDWRYWILPAFLVLALLGVGYWGYDEYRARQSLQNRAESQYQKDFYELTWHVDEIAGQLARLMVSASREQNVLGLATLWRQIFAAQANIGGLPLAYVPLSKTEKFLSDTGEAAFALLNRTTQSEEGLTDKDVQVLEKLYGRAKVLKEDLAQLAAKILDRELSWTQVEVAAKQAGGELEDNTIVDGFELMEQKMEEYPEINVDEEFAQVRPDTKVVRSNQKISLEKAKEIARNWWFQPGDRHTANLTYEGVGDIPTYGLEFPPLEGESPVYIDISKLDGSVVWAMKPKTVVQIDIDLSEGERSAKSFLESHGFNNMVAVKVEQEGNTGVYTFVPRQGEVLLYPDQVKVQVAQDNGEVIGFEGTPYYMFHRKRELPAPEISEAGLRKMLSPRLKVELIRQALITNYWGKEILAWEVRGSFGEEKFAIFYNAETGSEEDIVRITPPPKFEFSVAG